MIELDIGNKTEERLQAFYELNIRLGIIVTGIFLLWVFSWI